MPNDKQVAPIFIVCCARSGSTLLRYVVDSHPEVGCPPETHLAELCRSLTWSYGLALDQGKKNALVIRKCRKIIDGIMSDFLQRVGKRRWCDKSISTVDHLELVHAIFPDAKFLFLYRNCMDVVHSGLEVSRYGYGGYGFASYVAKRPNNTVAAIMDYWCDKARDALDFEGRVGDAGHRVLYEELVADPGATIEKVMRFLDLEPMPDHVERVFSVSHQGGPGDSNIVFSRRFEQEGVGKGHSIPIGAIPLNHRQRANMLLEKIGYPIIGDDWSSGPSPYAAMLRGVAAVAGGASASSGTLRPSVLLDDLGRMLRGTSSSGTFKFVFDEEGAGTWALALEQGRATVSEGECAADCEVRMSLSALGAVVAGTANPMRLFNAGDLRVSGDVDFARRAFMA